MFNKLLKDKDKKSLLRKILSRGRNIISKITNSVSRRWKYKNRIFSCIIISKYKIRYNKYIAIYKNNYLTKLPQININCAVLQTKQEYLDAIEEVKSLGLPSYQDRIEKNWDSLAALSTILRHTNQNASVLDAGGELCSTILPWLAAYGYKNLKCINLDFAKIVRIGNISYEYGDLTHTNFKDNYFDAITCLSVIEHGVDIELYFKEMSRILKPEGVLIASADFWPTPIDTKDIIASGGLWQIFDKETILRAIDIAHRYNLELINNIRLEAKDKPVEVFGYKYTFIYFVLQKRD